MPPKPLSVLCVPPGPSRPRVQEFIGIISSASMYIQSYKYISSDDGAPAAARFLPFMSCLFSKLRRFLLTLQMQAPVDGCPHDNTPTTYYQGACNLCHDDDDDDDDEPQK